MIVEITLIAIAFFATLAALLKDDVYAVFSLGSAILFAALYILSEISPLLGIIIFAIYTGSVIGIIFLALGEEESGLNRYIAIALPLALIFIYFLYAYMPSVSVSKISIDISSLRDLIIPIAGGIAALIVCSQEVRENARAYDLSLPNLPRLNREHVR